MISTAGKVLENDGKLEVATELIFEALPLHEKLFPGDYSLLEQCLKLMNNKAIAYMNQNRDDKSLYLLKAAEKLVRKNPRYSGFQTISNMYNNMALALQRNKFLDFAKEYLEKAQSLNFRYKLPGGITSINYGCLLGAMKK